VPLIVQGVPIKQPFRENSTVSAIAAIFLNKTYTFYSYGRFGELAIVGAASRRLRSTVDRHIPISEVTNLATDYVLFQYKIHQKQPKILYF